MFNLLHYFYTQFLFFSGQRCFPNKEMSETSQVVWNYFLNWPRCIVIVDVQEHFPTTLATRLSPISVVLSTPSTWRCLKAHSRQVWLYITCISHVFLEVCSSECVAASWFISIHLLTVSLTLNYNSFPIF